MKSNYRPLLILLALAAVALLWYQYRKPRYVTGDPAADFTAVLADGSQARLSDLRGKYVLLQFWGSWCGPCRLENRHLAPLYEQYHDRGFEIFSVGLESKEANWQRAIQQDRMRWRYHTAEFTEFSGPLARQYNIRSIPATFLINPEGVIIGHNLSEAQLRQALEKAWAN